ncbi:UPF0669 protein v1g209471-like [Saccoglossus kowalevskii]|uniref:UPF0669 protein v1g209471-like n=1 Tax=Saccoglossus kowalevskii TaxID=10224 RepID=A0ABM0GQP0_SACKO|nr:PREDICTED: UPF0669 protein v1g209471-like [Saccoglossus kowalevskii]
MVTCMLFNSLYLYICLILILIGPLCYGQQLIHGFSGRIGAGNYTYYRLAKEGAMALVLDTLEGDADIYISSLTLAPSFEEYELQSATCGQDIVEIPMEMSRPIGVAVYGHVSCMESSYRLSVLVDKVDSSELSNSKNQHYETGEESLLWTIFVNILKILFDVLV